MRRATEATGYMTSSASASRITQHMLPQGFIIRSPLLTTNKVVRCTLKRRLAIYAGTTALRPSTVSQLTSVG